MSGGGGADRPVPPRHRAGPPGAAGGGGRRPPPPPQVGVCVGSPRAGESRGVGASSRFRFGRLTLPPAEEEQPAAPGPWDVTRAVTGRPPRWALARLRPAGLRRAPSALAPGAAV